MDILGHDAQLWQRMKRLEPRLANLVRRITEARPSMWMPFYWTGFLFIEVELRFLVGYRAKLPELRTREAWNVAYSTFLSAWQDAACRVAQEAGR